MRLFIKDILAQVGRVKSSAILKSKLCTKADANITEQFYESIRDRIIFSSYLEQHTSKLGYKKNKIQQGIIEKKEKLEKIEGVKAKPFPAALKYLEEDGVVETEHAKKIGTREINEVEIHKLRPPLPKLPENWMQDYEHFDEEDNLSTHGTPDASISPSKIPCSGCGAHLHCVDAGLPGYIPSEIFRDRNRDELKRIICQRCHFLKEYNIAVDVTVPAEKYVEILSSINDKFALAILLVDLLDFPISLWPGIQEILGNKRPIFLVGNKVDLLPKDSPNYLQHIKNCLTDAVLKQGLIKMNIKHVALISAKTGFGVEELITQLHNIWKYNGDVYLVGCTNVGKSSLFNALLRSDYCKVQATDLIQKATACPWPGTTLNMLKFPILRPSDFRIYQRCKRLLSERGQRAAEEKLRRDQVRKAGRIEHATLIGHIGRTFFNDEEPLDLFSMPKGSKPILALNERSKEYVNSKWCYDTPGVVQPEQIHEFLTTEELLQVMPTQMIVPRVFKLKIGMSLFLAGVGRIDFVSADIEYVRLTVYSSLALPILIVLTENANDIYRETLGSEFLKVPGGDIERLKKWPGLKSSEIIEITGELKDAATCDIILSSIGWVGIKIPPEKKCNFRAWTPHGRGITIRKPALIPFGENLRGKKIRGSVAYRIGKPFIKQ